MAPAILTRAPWLPGILLAAVGAAVAWLVHLLVPAVPWLTAALLLGVILGCVLPIRRYLDGDFKPGLGQASRRLLRIGIVLLGFQLSLGAVAALGWPTIVAIVGIVVVAFVVTWTIARSLRLPGDQPVLLAAGFSICGVSAVGAMSAARGSADEDSGAPVAMVTLYGSLAIVAMPLIAQAIGLSHVQFGRWVGASVHDVGQVVATAQIAGASALAVAVVVKLTRVLMLAPMVAIASVRARRSNPVEDGAARPPIVPLFIVGFVVAVLARSFLPIPPGLLDVASIAQSACLAAALFAIGAGLRLDRVARSGARTLVAGALSWIVLLGLGLASAVWL